MKKSKDQILSEINKIKNNYNKELKKLIKERDKILSSYQKFLSKK